MTSPSDGIEVSPGNQGLFATTHWSAVVAAGDLTHPNAQAALESLCRLYWYPLYAYVRRSGHQPEEAKDLTQEFFARFLEGNRVSLADPMRGRFRTFLLTALKHFLANEWKKAHRIKRGGDQQYLSWDASAGEQRFLGEPSDGISPEVIFERRWATALLEQVLDRLETECAVAGRTVLFEALKADLWGEKRDVTQAVLAERIGMSEGAYKVAAHRMRVRFRELLREEIAHTVATAADIDSELRHLIVIMSG
ncbi:MAG TPA: sigma-70 family RNA polymerase sigma factor [Candidatus Paceibacterota bacterium]|nr:sigma-70 family RNA polymerase sigma factor [Candidatus Paceibacterota bacterium]HSA02694.1 sigma-70 family RNA polymerase sigma factor [Candidatus Paceibacterota bacterium]